MPHPLFILNGSNLNMLGTREPSLYGTTTLAEIETSSRQLAESLGLSCEFRQTNHEGILVDWIQEAAKLEAAVSVKFSLLLLNGCSCLLTSLTVTVVPALEVTNVKL